MRPDLTIASLLILACAAPAQVVDDRFEVFPDRAGNATTFTSRLSLGTSGGEILQEVPGNAFAGIGNKTATCELTGIGFLLQDQNLATQEVYNGVVRRALAAGGPDATPGGIVLRTANQMLPVGTGAGAYQVTLTFATAVAVPCTGGLFLGVEVVPASWSTDGLSMHSAAYPPTGTLGDNPRAGAPNLSWQILNGTASPAASGRVMRTWVTAKSAFLNMGNHDPASTRSADKKSFGAGGMFPALAHGIEARVIDTPNAGGLAHLFLSLAPFGTGISLPSFGADLYLNLAGPVVLLGSQPLLPTGTPAVGIASFTVVPAGQLPPGVAGNRLVFQALTHGAAFANPRFTNAQAQSY